MATQADTMLRAFILDYLKKRGLTAAAEGMRVDHITKGEQTIDHLPFDSQDNFLAVWFGMFWDVFSVRFNTRTSKGRWQSNPQVQQPSQQQHQQGPPHQQQHPSQHLQQSQHQHPSQNPSSQQNQLPPQTSDPTSTIQQSQVPNAAQMLTLVGVDGAGAPGPAPPTQNQNRLVPANIVQNSQAMFAARAPMQQVRARAHQQQKQPQQQPVPQNMMNYPAFRNSQGSMQTAAQQMQNQQQRQSQLRHQQQQQAILQSSQRTQQNVSRPARMHNSSVDNRRAMSHGQLHSLSLDSTIPGQNALMSADQAVAMSGDLLDVRGAMSFEGLFPTVGTRTSPSRSTGAAAPQAPAQGTASGRGLMQIVGVQAAQAPIGSNGLQNRANGGKPRSFPGHQLAGSEAPSTASRRGSMDMSVDGRPYENTAIVDESQPRAGANGVVTSGKRRAGSQSVSRKSGGTPQPDETGTRRSALGPGSESGGPAKRQRSTGAFQRNAGTSPSAQLQKQFSGGNIEAMSRTLPQNGMQGHATGTSRAQVMAMHRQRQTYRPNADRRNNAQFYSQLSASENPMARGGNRYSGRTNGVPNPPPYPQNDQSQSNPHRDAFLQNQVPSGRRTPLSNANTSASNAGKGADGRVQSRASKGSDSNIPLPQAQQGGVSYPVAPLQSDSRMMQLPEMMNYIANGELPVEQVYGVPPNANFLDLRNGGPVSKKAVQGQQEAGIRKNVVHDQQSGVGTDAQQTDVQMAAQLGRKEANGSLRMRQTFSRGELLKQQGAMQIGKQEMPLTNEKKSKTETNMSGIEKQNGFRNELKRNSSSRAMKTIETTGGSRGRHMDGANKNNALNTPSGALPHMGLSASLVGSGSKRDRAATEADMENRSTKSDRQASGTRGGGTQSQKSTASGGSGAVEGRTQAANSSGTRRGRGRSRGRGSGGGRRARGERAPPRGGNGSRGGTSAQAARNNAQEQKNVVTANLQRNAEASRTSQADTDRMLGSSSILMPPRGSSATHENRSQTQKGERGARVSSKHVEDTDLQRTQKLPFDLGDANATAESRGPDVSGDQQPSGNHMHSGKLLEFFQQPGTGGGGRTNGDLNNDAGEKAFQVQQLNFMSGDGKLGNQSGGNYGYEISPYMANGVDETDLGDMIPPITDNLGFGPPPDLEDVGILGVDPGDLAIPGRSRS